MQSDYHNHFACYYIIIAMIPLKIYMKNVIMIYDNKVFDKMLFIF